MSRYFQVGVASAALCLISIAVPVSAAVTECDRQAGHGSDPNAVVAGVERSEMDLDAAEQACRQAVAEYPAHARSNYQLGRVLYYMGRRKESLPYLRRAADAGYPQAIFVLGYIQTVDDPTSADYCAAADLWKRSAALDHPWTGIFMVKEYLDGKFADCDIELTDDDLRRLAKLGIDHITYAESEGRVEAALVLLEQHLSRRNENEE